MSGRNSLITFNPAVDANEIPMFCEMFPTPFQLPGPQVLAMVPAPITPAVLDTEKACLPPGCRAVNVLTSACLVRFQTPPLANRSSDCLRVAAPTIRR